MVYSPKLLVFLTSIAMFFRNFICHALIMERLLATIWVTNYENYRSRWFTFTWVIIDIFLQLLKYNDKVYFERKSLALVEQKLSGRYQVVLEIID
uniref:Secreted protein n=1 Tax=Meloidogyne hapla TaxID=6305 RepID=A0A1I8BI66_MELHA